MGATVPPTMNPERVGRIPHTAARGMNLLIISLKTYASYLGKAPVIIRASSFVWAFLTLSCRLNYLLVYETGHAISKS